jgi:hypothetical protein
MTWLVGPTSMTCQLTGRWHGMPTGHADVTVMSCWCHPYPGQSHGSVYLVFGSGQPIRVKKTCGVEWGASVRVGKRLAGTWRRVRTCVTFDFSAVFTSVLVSSSSTQWYGQNTILTTFIFGQKLNTTLSHKLWYQLLGNSDQWCTDSCLLEA